MKLQNDESLSEEVLDPEKLGELKVKIKNQREELFKLHEIIAKLKHEQEVLTMALNLSSTLPDKWIQMALRRLPRQVVICGSTLKKVSELTERR